MQIILLLTVITIIITWVSVKIWKKTKNIKYMLGFFAMYYWTFCGAWVFVIDQILGAKGEVMGIHYYSFFDKLFKVHPDNNYFLMVLYYGLFFISIQLCILFLLRFKESKEKVAPKPIQISHLLLIIGFFLAVIFSYMAVHKNIMYSITQDISVYSALNTLPNEYLSLHKVFNLIAAFSLFFGFIVFLSGRDSIYFASYSNKSYGVLYFVAILVFILYLILIGNKHDLLFAGLFALLFYLKNSRKIILSKTIMLIVILALPLVLTDLTRGVPFLSSKGHEEKIHTSAYVEKELPLHSSSQETSTKFLLLKQSFASNKILSFAFNNEMFYAHFSMYGVLDKNIPLTLGSSLKSLVSSFIPRLIVRERPEDIYEYYTRQVNAKQGQGYTIHHATGWYLNFGVIGIIIGAVFWGIIWFFLEYFHVNLIRYKHRFLNIFFVLSPFLFVAYIPTMLRGGLEVYRALIYEVFLLPATIVFLASWLPAVYKKGFQDNNMLNSN